MRILRLITIVVYVLSLLSLFFYSFVQVDLGLTLTSHPFWLPVQQAFQEIGYFNRPLSTLLYLILLSLFFFCYLSFLYLASKHYLSIRTALVLTLVTFVVLVFSYNAFSYDLFNYIFDARIFTFYGDNPYEKRALDYPTDYHLGFMRWIHRTYPYGPLWLGISIPISFAGFQSLLLTMLLFKFLTGVCYVGSVWLIKKILEKIDPKHVVLGIVFFALNPLVFIESLVSSHNDIVMMVFALLSLYLLLIKRKWVGFASLLASIAIKFATIFFLPVYLYVWVKKDWIKHFDRVMLVGVICMSVAVLAASFRTQFQPWYLMFVLPFAAFIAKKDYVVIPTFFLSITSLLQYVPYLYFGNWDDPIPSQLFMLNMIGIGSSIVLFVLFRIIRRVVFRPHFV